MLNLKKLLTNVLTELNSAKKKTVQYRINQGANTFTLGNNFRGKITFYDSVDTRCGEEIIATTGVGNFIHKTVAPAAGITVSSSSTGTMTLTVNSSGNPYVEFYIIAGTITKQQ